MRARILPLLTVLAMAFAGCVSEEPAPSAEATTPEALLGQVGGTADKVVSVIPGDYNLTGPYSRVLDPGTLGIKAPVRVEVPSPLGSGDIEIGLHLPDTTEKVPVLVFASPYFFAEGSEVSTPVTGNVVGGSRTVLDRTPNSSFFSLIENFVPHGYAVAAVAVRGTAGSDGCNDLMGPDEIDDLDAAVTWLGEQEWSSGSIGMIGVSYDGSTPWSVASRGNPYLKTIIPISGVPDIYGLMYRNGSAETRGPFLLNALYIEGSYASGMPTDIPGRICPEAYEGLALSGVAGVTGSDPTGYWEVRNRKPGVEQNYKGSVLSVQGLQDWNVDPSQVIPWVDELDQMGLKTKQMLGQWGHAWPDGIGVDGANIDCSDTGGLPGACTRADWKEILLRWMDSELKGLDVDTGAPVQVRDSLGRWRNEADYPPRDATWTEYHLTQGFLRDEPGARESLLLLPHLTEDFPPELPPTVAASPHSAADFLTAPAEREMLIAGLPKVHVTVTPNGPGGYMAAYLYEVQPNGEETRIGWTTMNLAYANGGTTRTEVVPGLPLEVKMEIQPMDGVVRAGSQLLLRLWVFTDGDRLPTLPPSSVSLETGDGVRSVLILPTVERAPETYFTPPTVKAK